MSLSNGRIMSYAIKRVVIYRCPCTRIQQLLIHNGPIIKSINQPKLMKPDLFSVKKSSKQNDYKQSGPVDFYGFLLLGIPIAAFALGTWQVQRRQWKLNLIDTLQKRTTAEPTELPENLDELQSMEYYPIRVRGQFLYDKEFFIEPRSLIKQEKTTESSLFANRTSNGRLIVTPFKLENRDLIILVNRGWVPKKAKYQSTTRDEGTVEIVGIVRSHENRPPLSPKNLPESGVWYYRDVELMAKRANTAPVYLDLWSTNDPPDGPISCQTNVNLRNEHLNYIITWYSLSGITGYLWFRMFVQKLPLI